MGWTCLHKPKGMSLKDFFQKEWGDQVEILDCAANFRVAYMAVRTKATGQVWAAVILLNFTGDGQYNFCYKDMDESMGPNEARCPERILRLLSPLDPLDPANKYAINWRAKCWANIEARKTIPKVKDGDVIRFKTPISFGRYGTFDTFQVRAQKTGRGGHRTTLYTMTGLPCQIRRWREREFEIVNR